MNFIKKNLRVIIPVIIAIIICIVGIILLNTTSEKEEVKIIKTKEEELTELTGVSKEQAINVVKENFYSDNYKFEAFATNDNLYKVVVTNLVDNTEIIYFVEPATLNAYIDMD